MKSKGILAMALVGVLSVSAIAPSALAATSGAVNKEETTAQETVERHGKREKHEKAVEPENAIGKDSAKAAALADAGLTAEQTGKVKSHVSQLDDGTVIYKVSFTYDGQKYSYQIDAMTGKVLDKSAEDVTDSTSTKSHAHGKHGDESKIAEPENAIGKDSAKAAALADAGLTAEQTGKVKSRVSQLDDGTVIYKVSFTFDGQKYSYQIDAMTGKVLDKNTEDATETTAREFVGNRRRAKQANITAAAV